MSACVVFSAVTYICRFPEDSLYAVGAVLGWVYGSSFEAVESLVCSEFVSCFDHSNGRRWEEA